jgi:DNA-binding FadR family transcriptional regulator
MPSAAAIARKAPSGSSKKLMDQIQAHIEEAGLEAGRLIGTQNELCERYQVSQTVFFQATRILMDRGMAELRLGSGGGLFVSDRSLAQCGQRMAKYFECIGIRFDDCEEVNRMLQELCMRLATGRLPLAAVDRIRAMVC